MKRLVAIALVLAAAVIPASAQHGGGHSGFSGRGASSVPAFRGGQSFSSPSRFSGSFSPSMSRAPMPMARPASNFRSPGNRYPTGRPVGNRYPVRRGFPSRSVGYGFPSGTYIGYPFLDSSFDDYNGYDDGLPVPYAAPAPDSAAYGYTLPPEQYSSEPQPSAEPAARPEPEPLAATTLIFKDGRSPEAIRNYIATRSTITVIDGPRHHDIPVADLDIPATVKANRDSGVGFQLPAAR
jgi:hypothetical protein